jgi:hypothetical protein
LFDQPSRQAHDHLKTPMAKSPQRRAVDRQIAILSIALAPLKLLLVLLWLTIMYTIVVHMFPHAFGIDWPDPLVLIPWRQLWFSRGPTP